MTAERWRAVQDAFAAVRTLAPDARREYLSNNGVNDEVRAEVERLLQHHDSADGILDAGSDQIRAEVSNLVNEAAPLAADPLLGCRVGRYHVKSVIARGGMATVYEAVQESPHRVVALKVMKHNIASQTALRRFQFESQILARLRHPNIAQVFEAGVANESGAGGVPYFAMEYIPGARPITEYFRRHESSEPDAQARIRRTDTDSSLACASGSDSELRRSDNWRRPDTPADVRRRLALFAKVCDAVHHGHVKGIIHRDLKPGNILVDSAGEPKVIDFGVARATDSDLAVTTQQTSIGDLVGTMQYMSPEQCDADPHDIDTRSDVYSLGVVLYELLTGVLPYDAAGSRIHAMHQAPGIIRNVLPPPPSTVVARGVASGLRPGRSSLVRDSHPAHSSSLVRDSHLVRTSSLSRTLRGDVDTIVAKALAKDRNQRYASAAELAADVRRYLNREPIAARRPTVWERFGRWVTRHPAITTGLACGMIASLVLTSTLAVYIPLKQQIDAIHSAFSPRALRPSLDGRAIQLISNDAAVLYQWRLTRRVVKSPSEYGQLVEYSLGGEQRRLAILGFESDHAEFGGYLCAFDVDTAPEQPGVLWQHRIEKSDLPEWLRNRGDSEAQFEVRYVWCFDIFKSADVRCCGPEIVAVFHNGDHSQDAIRIYSLTTGDLLFEVWQDGGVSDCYWMPEAGLLVFKGLNAEDYSSWVDRGTEYIADRAPQYPFIVFALRPSLDDVSKRWVRDRGDAEHFQDADSVVPVWYRCLLPAFLSAEPRIVGLSPPPAGHPAGSRVAVNIAFGADGCNGATAVVLDEDGVDVGRRTPSEQYRHVFTTNPGRVPDPDGREPLLGQLPSLNLTPDARLVRHSRFHVDSTKTPRGRDASSTPAANPDR